ncbi:MAG TPA: adenylate/guanylate cyclase domain-containing protein [Acidimicrobiia bacterium]
MRIGAHPGESETQAGRRRIVVGYIVFGTPPRLIAASQSIVEGLPLYGMVDLLAAAVPAIGLLLLAVRPRWFVGIVNVLLAASLLENLVPTVMLGGILEADLLIAFSILTVIGALIALDRRAGFLWFLVTLATIILAGLLPEWIDPIYDADPAAAGDIVVTLIGVAVFSYAGMAYFVRQRDRFQRESDDLLHNILPDEIATRLKAEHSMIADDHEAASVLFADVVGFTPMSAGMSPPELVGLLNNVFTTFDGFVEELGLEKIKTVGDEYMAAAGVPHARPDHAHAIAELALRMRDHCAQHRFDGHDIRLRVGLNSGPVVAGIVGTNKFAYDLWGDMVNTASRMESHGVPGSIQVSGATHELLRDAYVCERRGTVDVKGKGEMETYFLLARRDGEAGAALADAPGTGGEPAGRTA